MRRITFVLLLVLQAAFLHSQGNSVPPRLWSIDKADEPAPFVFKPTIGLGTGMFSFYGDVYSKHLANFQVSRIGYELSVHQTLTPYLNIGFYTCFGKLGANERLITRNVNFESQIRLGGVHFEYNFQNFFRTRRNVMPWISVGFESFEFLSKTDLFDANGNRYYYWTDGSIRNLDQSDPFASQASFLVRDYTYETDVRNMNPDNFGRYPERSFAVPVGAGFTMHLTDKWDAVLGTTFHFTFTDYVDGVTAQSSGTRQGNAANDHFVMTSFSMRYNLTGKEKEVMDTVALNDSLYVFNDEDYDGDGILDLSDSCALTPKGVAVDLRGCPLDDDVDNTADYRDKELESPRDFITDENGIALTDSIILRRWQLYSDSTGEYHAINVRLSGQNIAGTGGAERKTYMVSLGTYNSAITNEQMMRFLSVPDIGTHTLYDSSTAYTAGKFYDLVEAERRRKALEAQGFPKAVIVYKTPEGKLVEVTGLVTNTGGNTAGNNNGGNTAGNNGNNNGGNSNNTNGGNTAGNNGNTNAGNNSGNNSGNNAGNNGNAGNNNAGNNNAGNTAGNNGNSNNNSNNVNSNRGNNGVTPMPNDTGIVFRVQVGAFSRPISKNTFSDVPNLLVFKTDDGLYKYMSGSYKTFQEASDAKAQLLVKGYSGAFIVAYKQGKRIPLEKAGAIYMKQEPQEADTAQGAGTKSFVEFQVQLGAYKNAPSPEDQAKFEKVAGLKKTTTSTGLTRYTVGSTSDYKTITALKEQMKAQGFPECFIIAFYKGEQVSVPEAIELSK